ncbi:class I SAM-dependent methyltransferase [Salsuginibacillus kocurii]|uniref:class I SAM-dependent methyltransferase n=1 Tax=Salsuginibacillus kocurii TaxID=427078 RepID=UPI000382435D|nr:class I SAM-dependent methyltransferase [Salsuginibacillus kocurii]
MKKAAVNFGNVSKAYAKGRNDLPADVIPRLTHRGTKLRGNTVVDLGAGSGVLSRELSKSGARVYGVEPSKEMIEEAVRLEEERSGPVKYIQEYAEDTRLPGKMADTVTVLRAWHWMNTTAASKEVKRLLKPGGEFLVMDSGFSKRSPLLQATFRIVESHMTSGKAAPAGSKAYSKQFIHSFPVEWFEEWKNASFDLQETFKWPYDVAFTADTWCDRVASLSWLAAMNESQREAALAELKQYMNETYALDTVHTIAHNFYVARLRVDA